ncbi:uncharacterized protein LOC144770595 isoform X3 [Lissotriton helveticus]
MRAGGPRAPPFHFGYGVLSRTIFSIHDVLLRCQSSKSQEMTNGLSGLTRCVNQKAPRNLRIVFYTDVTESYCCQSTIILTTQQAGDSSQDQTKWCGTSKIFTKTSWRLFMTQ